MIIVHFCLLPMVLEGLCSIRLAAVLTSSRSIMTLNVQALVTSSAENVDSVLRNIFTSIVGIIYLGTPHRGTPHIQEWMQYISPPCRTRCIPLWTSRSQTQHPLYESLRFHSPVLETLLREFSEISSNFKIVSIFESLPTILQRSRILNEPMFTLVSNV